MRFFHRFPLLLWAGLLTAALVLSAACAHSAMGKIRERGESPDWAIPSVRAQDDVFDSFFNPLGLIEIRIGISVEEWNAFLHDYDSNSRNETSRSATVRVQGNGVEARLEGVGFRERGNTSRIRPESGSFFMPHDPSLPLTRFHFKLKFDETFSGDESAYGEPSRDIAAMPEHRARELLPGVRRLNFKHNVEDPSFVGEAFCYDLLRRFGVEAARTTFARVWLRVGEEEERYLGVYTVLEDYDERWLRRRAGNKDALMVKGLFQRLGPADLSRQDPDGSLSSGLIGREENDPPSAQAFAEGWKSYRPSYDIKSGEAEAVAAELNALMAFLASKPSAEKLDAAFEVQPFLRFLAANAMLGMADDYWRGGNNFYLWKNPGEKWNFIPFDYDRSFGIPTFGPATADSSLLEWGNYSRSMVNPVLVKAILAQPRFAADYRAYLLALRDTGLFSPFSVRSRLLSMQDVIEPFVEGGAARGKSEAYSGELGAKLSYVRKRLAVLERECP